MVTKRLETAGNSKVTKMTSREERRSNKKQHEDVPQEEHDYLKEGALAYQEWRDTLLKDPETRLIYEREAAKKELWLQLVEARQAAGLTQVELAERLGVSQAQVARIEKSGYDAYTLNTLRRYLQAVGRSLEIVVI